MCLQIRREEGKEGQENEMGTQKKNKRKEKKGRWNAIFLFVTTTIQQK